MFTASLKYDTSKRWQGEWWWLIIELRNAVIAGFLLLLRSPPFYPPSFHLARSQINGWADDYYDDDGGGDYDDSGDSTGALVARPNCFFKTRFKKLFGILGWDILDVSDFFLFECCIHNRLLARRMQIQEPMVLLLLGEASWCKFLLGGGLLMQLIWCSSYAAACMNIMIGPPLPYHYHLQSQIHL